MDGDDGIGLKEKKHSTFCFSGRRGDREILEAGKGVFLSFSKSSVSGQIRCDEYLVFNYSVLIGHPVCGILAHTVLETAEV